LFFQSTTFGPEYYGIAGAPLIDSGSNSVVVVDEQRNAVALTTSVNDDMKVGVMLIVVNS
jgi:hypothetical protein